MNRLIMGFAAASLAATAALAAPGQQDKPDIDVTTRAAVISVTVDKELKPYPGLPANLVAEGRRFVAKARADSDEEYRTNKDWFRDEGRTRRWTYERVYYFRSLVGNRYVSIVRDDGTYTGGAHPNTHIDTILWDANAKKRISIRPFFTEMADDGPTMKELARLIRLAVVTEKRRRWKDARPDDAKSEADLSPEQLLAKDEQVAERVAPRLTAIGPITLAPSTESGKSSGLTVHYSPYDVDAYAAGPYTVFVPYEAFRRYLSPEGAAIFGGERPKTDIDNS
jgi:hypothetical protein